MSGGKRVVKNGRGRRNRRPAFPFAALIGVLLIIVVTVMLVHHWWSSDPKPEGGFGGTPQVSASIPSAEEGEEPSDAPAETPEPSQESSPEPTNPAGAEDWELLLVNRWNAIPEGYEVTTVTLSNGYEVDERIYPDLQEMFDDMRAQGVYPVVASGYRTTERQTELMDEKIEGYLAQGYSTEEATEEALLWVAVPGTSEHQTGLAVDINADGVHSAGYEVYDWLAKNAWQYGFILRYPEGKEELTATDYEPWHYRYVGRENAKLIYNSGLCLEEYLGNTDHSSPITYTYSG